MRGDGALAPYNALPESIQPTQFNAANAFGAAQSMAMDFGEEDLAPMDALNNILWHAIKGADVPYPASDDAK